MILCICITLVHSIIREVSVDGTQQYTSIPLAISESVDGDTVLVHPGRYTQHIDVMEREITLLSMYYYSQNRDDIHNTIIDANFESNCLRVENQGIATVNGFTFTNGVGFRRSTDKSFGGGILLNDDSELNLFNSIVINNESDTGGGILSDGHSTLRLYGNVIKNNRTRNQAGGVSSYISNIYFDQNNLNSIYDNIGQVHDIFLYTSTCEQVLLDTLSVDLSECDGCFVSYYSANEELYPEPSISNIHSVLEQVDSDIYVSPWGDDSNSGLTPETPMKTIAYATRRIQSNITNPNTVYLLPGTYSIETNNQFFPVALQSNTNLLGLGNSSDEVNIGEEWGCNTIIISYANNTEIGYFTMRKSNLHGHDVLSIGFSQNINIHDINFVESITTHPGIGISHSYSINVSNCTFSNLTNTEYLQSLFTYISEVTLNNLIFTNISSTAYYGLVSVMDFDDSIVNANNIIVTDCYQEESGVMMQYSNIECDSPGGGLNLNNFLFYNNTSTCNRQPLIIIVNFYEPSFINNATIANNIGPTSVLRFLGDYTVRNSIMYNPSAPGEIRVWDGFTSDDESFYSDIDIDYCLIRNGFDGIGGINNPHNVLDWGENNLDTDPLFRGDVYGDCELEDIEWVQLTPDSPCINAGTPDTLGMGLPAFDVIGNPRVWDGIVDIGAFEYNPTPNDEHVLPTPPSSITLTHYPNPVNISKNGCAFIDFTLPKRPVEKPKLEIYNIRGQKVRDITITQSLSELVRATGLSKEENQSGEKYSLIWDGKDNSRKKVSSGIYFYKVSSEGKSVVNKMMVVK